MSSFPAAASTDSESPRERLDVPVLPPSGSRFVLPPPPSDLLNRLQAFLPQIKSANEQLEQQGSREEAEEEAVVMEELSSDSEDETSSSDDDSDSCDDEEDSDKEKVESQEAGVEQEQGNLDRLMDINSRPKVVKRNLVVVEAESNEEKMEDK
ncbi:hypothetical protein JCM3765_004050 [Sporobolomyces pararoseus]